MRPVTLLFVRGLWFGRISVWFCSFHASKNSLWFKALMGHKLDWVIITTEGSFWKVKSGGIRFGPTKRNKNGWCAKSSVLFLYRCTELSRKRMEVRHSDQLTMWSTLFHSVSKLQEFTNSENRWSGSYRDLCFQPLMDDRRNQEVWCNLPYEASTQLRFGHLHLSRRLSDWGHFPIFCRKPWEENLINNGEEELEHSSDGSWVGLKCLKIRDWVTRISSRNWWKACLKIAEKIAFQKA